VLHLALPIDTVLRVFSCLAFPPEASQSVLRHLCTRPTLLKENATILLCLFGNVSSSNRYDILRKYGVVGVLFRYDFWKLLKLNQ
jgi:hypothetical protein